MGAIFYHYGLAGAEVRQKELEDRKEPELSEAF